VVGSAQRDLGGLKAGPAGAGRRFCRTDALLGEEVEVLEPGGAAFREDAT
jgi:hypothetical protein